MARSYFSYSVVRADSSNLTTGGDAILTSLKDVNWSVKLVDSSGGESATAIYNAITGTGPGVSINGAGGTTGFNGLIEFWADPGQYVIKITDPSARIADKNIYWDSVSGQTGGIPGEFISSESLESDQIKDSEVGTSDLAASSVTTAKINNLAVTNAKIADSTLEYGKLASSIVNQLVPLGTVLDWFPQQGATGPTWGVPAGYAICNGANWNDIDNNMGSGGAKRTSGTIPNLVGKYVIGANPSSSIGAAGTHSTSAVSQTAPGISGAIGSNTTNNNSHGHSIPSHFHEMSHWHDVAGHTHGIPVKAEVYTKVSTSTSDTGGTPALSLGTTSTGGASASYTGGPKYRQWWDGATNNNARDNTAEWSGNTNGITGEQYEDNRPESIGLLKIMKVKIV